MAQKGIFFYFEGKLQGFHYEQTIVLGDFNGVIDTTLDRLCPTNKTKIMGKIPKSGMELMSQEELIDIWRLWYKNKRDYTFLSSCQKSKSRTDMIWGSKNLSI